MSRFPFIVDDDVVVGESIPALLEFENYPMLSATYGREALGRTFPESPDAIRLDIRMPKMDGFEVCCQLRSLPAMAEVPILILTALGDQASFPQDLEAGTDDFLAEPSIGTRAACGFAPIRT